MRHLLVEISWLWLKDGMAAITIGRDAVVDNVPVASSGQGSGTRIVLTLSILLSTRQTLTGNNANMAQKSKRASRSPDV